MDFYRAYYAPNNATVVLAGGFDNRGGAVSARGALWRHCASELQRVQHGDEPQQTELRRKDMDLEMQPRCSRPSRSLPSITKTVPPWLYSTPFTAGDSSRLQRRFIDRLGCQRQRLASFQHEALYELPSRCVRAVRPRPPSQSFGRSLRISKPRGGYDELDRPEPSCWPTSGSSCSPTPAAPALSAFMRWPGVTKRGLDFTERCAR